MTADAERTQRKGKDEAKDFFLCHFQSVIYGPLDKFRENRYRSTKQTENQPDAYEKRAERNIDQRRETAEKIAEKMDLLTMKNRPIRVQGFGLRPNRVAFC